MLSFAMMIEHATPCSSTLQAFWPRSNRINRYFSNSIQFNWIQFDTANQFHNWNSAACCSTERVASITFYFSISAKLGNNFSLMSRYFPLESYWRRSEWAANTNIVLSMWIQTAAGLIQMNWTANVARDNKLGASVKQRTVATEREKKNRVLKAWRFLPNEMAENWFSIRFDFFLLSKWTAHS